MKGKVRLASGALVAPDHMLIGIAKIAEAWGWKEVNFKNVVTAAKKRPEPKNRWILRLPRIRRRGKDIYALRADEAMRWYWLFVVWFKVRSWQSRDKLGRISAREPLDNHDQSYVPRSADKFAQERFAAMQARILAMAAHAAEYGYGERESERGTLKLAKTGPSRRAGRARRVGHSRKRPSGQN